ncbi:MAG: ATP-binding protein [Sulfobacillus sp.]
MITYVLMDAGLLAVSMVLSEKLKNIFSLDPAIATTLTVAISQSLSKVDWRAVPSWLGRQNFLVGAFCLFIALAWRRTGPWLRRKFGGQWSEVRIFDGDTQAEVLRYFEREIKATSSCFGSLESEKIRAYPNGARTRFHVRTFNSAQPPCGVAIPFYDVDLNVRGRFTVFQHREEVLVGDDKEMKKQRIDLPEIVLQIRNRLEPGHFRRSSAAHYLEDLLKRQKELDEAKDGIAVYAYRNFKPNHALHGFDATGITLYRGPRLAPEQRRIYFDTFFHPRKEELLRTIERVHYAPEEFARIGQTARASYLLYGPPGSGKSSFGHRVAMTLNRHLCSVDLTRIGDKETLMRLLYCPNNVMPGGAMRTRDAVFVFDEFDAAIRLLVESQKLKQAMVAKYASDAALASREGKPPPPPDDDRLDVQDLLEVLQGPVPMDGAIIIATTNDLAYVRNTCPALIRPGRLTPVEFTNLTAGLLNDVGRWHFGERIFADEEEFRRRYRQDICMSEVLSLVTEAKTRTDLSAKEQVDYFRNELANMTAGENE